MNGYYGVGIGALSADTDLDIFASNISIDASMPRAVGIGTLEGNCSVYIHNALVTLHISGVQTIGIGTLHGKNSTIEICEASAIVNVIGDNCSAISALKGETNFKLVRASIHITSEGEKALAIGGFSGNTKILLENSDSYIRINSENINYNEYIKKDNIEKIGGRIKFIFNDNEITD